jgi:hypothetical protein
MPIDKRYSAKDWLRSRGRHAANQALVGHLLDILRLRDRAGLRDGPGRDPRLQAGTGIVDTTAIPGPSPYRLLELSIWRKS